MYSPFVILPRIAERLKTFITFKWKKIFKNNKAKQKNQSHIYTKEELFNPTETIR